MHIEMPPQLSVISPEELDEENQPFVISRKTKEKKLENDGHIANAAKPPRRWLQLLFGSAGIYVSYLYHGNLEEDLFRDTEFSYIWMLQGLESLAAIFVGLLGKCLLERSSNKAMSIKNALTLFFKQSSSQLLAKVCTSLSLSVGVSFPVVVLAKSAKIVPVMMGSLFLGGSSYSLREYAFVLLLVTGTLMLVSGGEQQRGAHESNLWGLLCLFSSLCCDGLTAGWQTRLQKQHHPSTYDFLVYTNLIMIVLAMLVSTITGEIFEAVVFLKEQRQVLTILYKCCLCSAIGQSFIFYIISIFCPLVLSTVTTTRKLLSVVLSILFKGHVLTGQGWTGLVIALAGLLLEIEGKVRKQSTMRPG